MGGGGEMTAPVAEEMGGTAAVKNRAASVDPGRLVAETLSDDIIVTCSCHMLAELECSHLD